MRRSITLSLLYAISYSQVTFSSYFLCVSILSHYHPFTSTSPVLLNCVASWSLALPETSVVRFCYCMWMSPCTNIQKLNNRNAVRESVLWYHQERFLCVCYIYKKAASLWYNPSWTASKIVCLTYSYWFNYETRKAMPLEDERMHVNVYVGLIHLLL